MILSMKFDLKWMIEVRLFGVCTQNKVNIYPNIILHSLRWQRYNVIIDVVSSLCLL